MCGIAGIVELGEQRVSVAQLKSMADRMTHRGPDDDGFHAADHVGMGFRRLSIIDVEGGHQPISNETADIHLVFNGEIYNHVELRQQLIARGHRFKTASDAEVILHLYEDKGAACLADLNGMFGFALHDARKSVTWIARDRLGIKPIFYARTPTRFVFASDITALRAIVPTDVDAARVLTYLGLSYAPRTETVWRGVNKLEPGHHVWIEGRHVRIERYWSITAVGTWRGSVADAERQLEELLSDAVRLQLRADVPLGVFSSGGLDSSAIVAIAARQLAEPLRTYTINFEGKDSEDARWARKLAEQYQTAHTEIQMGPGDAGRALDRLVSRMDEPLADSALLPAYWLSQAARDRGIKVLLNGAGGDEIFGGYARHWPARIGSPAWIADTLPPALRRMVAGAWGLLQPDRGVRAADPALAWAAGVAGVELATARRLLRNSSDYDRLLDAVRAEYAGLNRPGERHRYAQDRMLLDLETYLPNDVLALTDKATMAASVEGRVPLLDHRLVEFAFALPPEINFAGGERKGLFKRVVGKLLPPGLLERRKEGFNAPDGVWLREGSTLDLSAELIQHRSPILDELIDPRALAAVLKSPERRHRAAGTLFALFLFNRWHRAHVTSLQSAT